MVRRMHTKTGRVIGNSVPSVGAGGYRNPHSCAAQIADHGRYRTDTGDGSLTSSSCSTTPYARCKSSTEGDWPIGRLRDASTLQLALEIAAQKFDSPVAVERRVHIGLAHT